MHIAFPNNNGKLLTEINVSSVMTSLRGELPITSLRKNLSMLIKFRKFGKAFIYYISLNRLGHAKFLPFFIRI